MTIGERLADLRELLAGEVAEAGMSVCVQIDVDAVLVDLEDYATTRDVEELESILAANELEYRIKEAGSDGDGSPSFTYYTVFPREAYPGEGNAGTPDG